MLSKICYKKLWYVYTSMRSVQQKVMSLVFDKCSLRSLTIVVSALWAFVVVAQS
jgi:hypothetical protein